MKKLLLPIALFVSFSAIADDIALQNLTKKEIEDVTTEFAVNFSHTAVAAPETEGLWGVEVGLIAGKTGTPELSDVIDRTGNDGDDFKNAYHAGLMGRAHFPFDLFLELTVLPEREISDITVENRTLGLGWNAGEFFNLPLDVAIGMNFSRSDISFDQTTTVANTPIESNIAVESKTRVLWIGVSKNIAFFTPYAKIGTARQESEITTSTPAASVFDPSLGAGRSVSAENSGGYWAVGANVQLLLLRLGVEASRTIDVSRVSGKLSLAF